MTYAILKLFHTIGFILIGAGLVGVFIADLRSRQAHDIRIIAEACGYVAIFYDGIVVPGAVLAGLSGIILTINMNLSFFQIPWLTGMWMLFTFEFVEGNTITRTHFQRKLRLTREALRKGGMTPELQKEIQRKLPTLTHYLDLPLFLLIVSLGTLRPLAWSYLALGVLLALVAAFGLATTFSRPAFGDRPRNSGG